MNNQLRAIFVAVGLAMAGQVVAATSWTLASNYGAITPGVTVSAYANTGSASDTAANTANAAALQTIEAATWTSTYGGIYNQDNCTNRPGPYCDAVKVLVQVPARNTRSTTTSVTTWRCWISRRRVG